MGYTESAIKGVSWMTGLQTVFRAFTFLKIVILARLLTPSQFGVFGIASLALSFLEILTETGINTILIQSKKEIRDYLDSAWVVSIIRGIVIFLGIVVLSPLITNFFKSPNALGIILLISLVPLVRGFINPAVVSFQKNLNFKYEFLFRSFLYFIDALVAIIVAFVTHSVYSLAIGLLVAAVFEVIFSFLFIKPIPKLKFNIIHLKEIFHLGKWVTSFSIFNYLGENLDNIVVGKLLGVSSLGIYQMAYRISILPITEISDVVSKVTFPLFSKIQDDKQRLKNAYIKTTLFTSVLTVCLGLTIFLFSNEIIQILLGPQWESAANVLKVLAIYGIIKSLISPASVVFLATAKQKYLAVVMFVRLLIVGLTIIPLVLTFGVIGAGYSQIIAVIITAFFSFLYLFIVLKGSTAITVKA